MTKVLITGMSGLIGGLIGRHLQERGGYELTALNRSPVEGVRCHRADIADLEAIKPAFAGQDVVVHCAAYVEDINNWEGNLSGNIIGVYNVFEAARLAGVKRVVFASSGAAISSFLYEEPYNAIVTGRWEDIPPSWPMITHDLACPATKYGAAKVWGEAIGRHFSDEHGMSVLCVRIGSTRRENRPMTSYHYSIYLSHRDVVQIHYKSMVAPDDVKYDIFMATSKNQLGFYDLEHPRQVIGYEPEDSVDVFDTRDQVPKFTP
jgi:nucleoside-diphosphate-sugar epimerase